jgi:cytochrome oxidase Cu insertion factor (SCO1/SenC/PrrC family)
VLGSPQRASDFTLVDQRGNPFHLADARGKIVVLSFIYTHCTDICPFETLKIRAAIPLLGPDVKNVEFVAVTTDPARDTQQVVADYSREAGLFDAWHFLTGSVDAVEQVWADYGIGVLTQADAEKGGATADTGKSGATSAADSSAPDVSPTQGLTNADLETATRLIDRFGGGYEVAHTAPFWFIDTAGKLRATMDADVLPADIAYNVRVLLHGR